MAEFGGLLNDKGSFVHALTIKWYELARGWTHVTVASVTM